MTYSLRFWLLLLAFWLGWFHMARGQGLIMVGDGTYEIELDSIAYQGVDHWFGWMSKEPPLTVEDVRRMIDSALAERQYRDTCGIDTPHFHSVNLPGSITFTRPDSCLKVDTVWSPPTWILSCAVMNCNCVMDSGGATIDRIDSTWEACDD